MHIPYDALHVASDLSVDEEKAVHHLWRDQLLYQCTMWPMISIDHCVKGLPMFHGYSFEGAADDVVVDVCGLRAAICVPVCADHHKT